MEISERRIIDLETRLAYQEDLLLSLNDVVSRQQMQIDRLEAQLATLVNQLQKLATHLDWPDAGTVEIPPHY
jgi:SlyX protein